VCRSGEVSRYDVQRWLVHLLTRYGYAYASNHFRALQQFFRWLARRPGRWTGICRSAHGMARRGDASCGGE
jgi:hypothetical protein